MLSAKSRASHATAAARRRLQATHAEEYASILAEERTTRGLPPTPTPVHQGTTKETQDNG
jgi:hypothetical protein